jgi:predicted metal-dependent hydrolase
MHSITPRVPEIDWSQDFERYWYDGSPAMTHWFNAMSLLFPLGERFFRDTALEVAAGLDLSRDPPLQAAVRDFAAQESLHAAQHRHYNDVLLRQGYENVVDASMAWWREQAERYLSPLTRLAIVCTYEHYTAVLAEDMLRPARAWMRTSPDMALLWGWHAVEEAEHKSVCFDLYQAAGGGWLRRVTAFVAASVGLNLLFFGRQYLHLRRQDRRLRKHALRQAAAAKGRARALFRPVGIDVRALLSYLKPSFHPWQRDNRALMAAWLEANKDRLDGGAGHAG